MRHVMITLIILSVTTPSAFASLATSPPLYNLSKYNEVYQRQAHNSYDHGHEWTDNFDDGIYNVEIDIRNHNPYNGDKDWKVRHTASGGESNNCFRTETVRGKEVKRNNSSFKVCLRNIREWHDDHPDHPPITIVIDKKDEWDNRDSRGPSDFDWRINKELGSENIFRPSDLKGDHTTLRAAVEAGAWPKLKDLRGKFIILITPHQNWAESRREANYEKTALYVEELGSSALAFTCPRGHRREISSTVSGYTADQSGWVVCFNHSAGDGDYRNGTELQEAGYLLRVWAVRNRRDYVAAYSKLKATFIVIDNPIKNSYKVEQPEGIYVYDNASLLNLL